MLISQGHRLYSWTLLKKGHRATTRLLPPPPLTPVFLSSGFHGKGCKTQCSRLHWVQQPDSSRSSWSLATQVSNQSPGIFLGISLLGAAILKFSPREPREATLMCWPWGIWAQISSGLPSTKLHCSSWGLVFCRPRGTINSPKPWD